VLGRHDDRVLDVAFTQDGRWILTASDDQTVRRWDAVSGEPRVLASGLGLRPVFAKVPGDRKVAVSGDRGRVLLVDLDTASMRDLGSHRGGVYRLAVSPDQRMLASAGRDGAVRLWNLEQGALDAVLETEIEVRWVAFSPDSREVAVAGMDSLVRLWSIAARPLVPDEPRAIRAWMAGLSSAAFDPLQRGATR
jgi:WD40 repeat protein